MFILNGIRQLYRAREAVTNPYVITTSEWNRKRDSLVNTLECNAVSVSIVIFK